ncbi:MAG TPA: MBL fold metallo-hydrolase [Vicinamibacterales bacterium]
MLFDTGNDARIFRRNVRQLGIDLRRLDAVIVSHRHGDHASGLDHVLRVNSRVQVYSPRDPGILRSEIPDSFLERYPGLPQELQYSGGETPRRRDLGTQWPSARCGDEYVSPVTRAASRSRRARA